MVDCSSLVHSINAAVMFSVSQQRHYTKHNENNQTQTAKDLFCLYPSYFSTAKISFEASLIALKLLLFLVRI
jgi:hypothetical protein